MRHRILGKAVAFQTDFDIFGWRCDLSKIQKTVLKGQLYLDKTGKATA
nr:MAG TPA: hypothetical protein [Caudoviricetes sp.]